MLVSKTIPNLINGVSQQPDSLRFSTQCEAQENAYPSVVEGLTKRLPSEHLMNTEITGDAKTFVHIINRDEVERYAVIIRDQSIKVFDLVNLNEETVDDPDGVTYLDTDNADTAFRAVTISDVTFIVNTETTPEMASDATPSSVSDYEALVFVKQGTSETTTDAYEVVLDDGTYTTTIGVDGESQTTEVAKSIASGIEAIDSSEGGDNWSVEMIQPDSSDTATRTGHIVYIKNTSTNFTISSSFRHGSGYIESFKDSTQRFSDLPTTAKDGMILKVDGDPADIIDDYYVKFVTHGTVGSVGEGLWEECAGPAISDGLKFNAATMPHVLIRQADNTFVFKKADGATHDSYDYSTFSWGDRVCGDLDTNPNPSFIGEKINDIFLFKNRLGFLAGENVIMSESGKFFNFLRTTVVDLLDSELIDVASAHNRVAVLRHAVPLAQKLVLFSDTSQFILEGQPILTPKTVAMAHATSYECFLNCTPKTVGASIIFGFDRGSFAGVREYVAEDTVEDVFRAPDISSHVPKYIPGKISMLAAASHENVVACTADGDTDSLYIYNFLDSRAERLQSAWHKFTFGTDAKILGIGVIETELYMVVYRTQGVFIEKMAFEPGKTDTNVSFMFRLDRRFTNATTGVSISWDEDTGLTTVTMPYQKRTRSIELVTEGGERFQPSIDDAATTFTVEKNLTAVTWYAGEVYEMSYQMSDITLKEPSPGGGRAIITDGRAQLRYGTLVYDESSYFVVEVTQDHRDLNQHKFTGRILGSGNLSIGAIPIESGEYRFPVFSKADQVTITIKNDTPLPSNLMSAEFELNWNPRARRIGL